MVFVLLGPPTGVVRRPITTAEDTPALLPMTSARWAPPRPTVGPAAPEQYTNWKEFWRYSRKVLPPGIPERHVGFTFVTRTDYGKNLLRRDGPLDSRHRRRAPQAARAR